MSKATTAAELERGASAQAKVGYPQLVAAAVDGTRVSGLGPWLCAPPPQPRELGDKVPDVDGPANRCHADVPFSANETINPGHEGLKSRGGQMAVLI